MAENESDTDTPSELDVSNMDGTDLLRVLVTMFSEVQEDGLPILSLSATEEQLDDGRELNLFTELRGIHLALKEQNKVIAKGVSHVSRATDALDRIANYMERIADASEKMRPFGG